MTDFMRRAALALTLMLCAAIGADAAGLEEAKGLVAQKKYDEAYAAIEKAATAKDASAQVLATGMSAALGSGRIVMASGLAKRLVKATSSKNAKVLYRCAEIAVLAGEHDIALSRYRAFIELSPDTTTKMHKALGYVLPRGTFPEAYKKALTVLGPDSEQMWKQGERIFSQLLKVEEFDKALDLAELLCTHYGKQALRADAIASAIHSKRDKYDKKDDMLRILKMLTGTNVSERWVQEFYNQAAKSAPLNERLEFLFSASRADRLLSKHPVSMCQDMRLLKSDADRLRFGRRYLAWGPAYRAKGNATLYDAYVQTIMRVPQVFKIEGQPLVDSAKATAMFEASVAMRKGRMSWDQWNQFLTGYLRENPAAEEAMLRKHLARLPKEAFRKLVELTKGAELDAMLAQYSGGSYAKTMQADAYLLSTYDTLKLKNRLFKAAQAQILANPAAFEIGQIQQYFCNSAAATIAEKSAVLLGLLNQLGSTPRFEELAKNLARDKKWMADPSFKQFQQGVQAKKTGSNPFMSAYTAAVSEKLQPRHQRNQRLEELVRKALASFPGTIPGDSKKAANATEWMAGNLYEYHRESVWDSREAVAAMGEIWGPKFRDMGPRWDSLVERGSVEGLRKLVPHFTSMLDKGGKASDKSWSAFASRHRPIQPKDDTSVLFEKHYGQMGRYVWDYFYSRRDAWGAKIYHVQLEKALAAGAGKKANDHELMDAANQALHLGQRAKPRVMVPMALMRQLYSDYMAFVKKSGKTDQIHNMESTLARCKGFTAQDRQAMVDSNLQRIAAMQGRAAQLSELNTFLAHSQLLDEESRKHVLTTTLKAQLDAMQPSDWSTARVHGAVMNHLSRLGKDNALAGQIMSKLVNGLLMGAQATESRSCIEPMRNKAIAPLFKAGRWEQSLMALDAYSRMVMENRDWSNWAKTAGVDPVLELINAADKPEIAYVFATMVIDRARYSREQVAKDMLAIRAAAAKDIPGLIPVSKDDPLYNLYIAARAVAERDEKRAWDLTRPRLNIVRQEWPTLDISFVAWTVDQMRKDSMLKEAREFCFEILLKEYDLPAEDVASVMLTKGDAYRDMNNFQAAAIEYKSLKDNKRYRTTQRGSLAKYRLIDLLIETGEFGAAEGQLMAMTEGGSRDEQAEAYYLLGKIAFEQEDYVQSRDNLLETFKRVDGHAEGRLLEGELKLKLPRGLASTEVLLGRLDLQTVVVPGRELTLKLRDTNLSIAQGGQSIPVIVSTSLGGDRESVRLTVSPDDKTLFQGSIATALGTPKHGNMSLEIYGGEKVSYIIDPAYQKANEIDYSAKILDVKSNARLVASSGEFLTPEEEEQRRMEQEMRRREGDRESVRFSQQRGTVVRPGSAIYVQVTDYDRDVGEQKDTVTIDARTSSGDLVAGFTLTETEVHSGVFEGELETGIPFPQVTASDVEEGADPNAIINSTKKGSWVSLPDGVNPKWVDVDTMSSHAVKSITIKTPDASRIKSMRVVGVLDANPITLGNYRIDGQELPLGGVAQLINKQHVGQELVDAREALGKGGKISEVSSIVYRRADTDHKGRDGWVNISLSGTFWVDEESRMTFKFMQPASPNGWQSVWLSIDGRPVLGARGMSQGLLQATKAVTLSAGAHTMEVIMVDHWKDSSVIVGLGQDDGTFVPMPASLFSVTENTELADALRPRGKVTQTGDGFSVALTKPERIRSIRCLFDDFTGDGLAVSEISMTAGDGKAILPTTHDFSTGLENDLLEIAAGDAIEVSYVDEQRLHTKSPKLAAKLSASFYNATVDLLYEIILTRSNGDEELVHADAKRVNPGAQVVVRVTDYDMDLTDERDTIPVTLTTAGGETLKLTLLEGHHVNPEAKNQAHTGIFSEFLKLGDVTGKNTLKVLPKDEITVTYLDKENTLPGIPVNRDLSVVTAPDELPIISVYPTHIETVEDTSREGKAKRVKLENMGEKDVKLMRDQIVAGAPVTLETPLRVSVQAPIIFSVQHKTLALHARSISHIYAVAASELAAAKRDGREPLVTRIPLRLSRSTDVAIGKGFRLANRAPGYQPLEEGIFGGVIRLQIGNAGDEADTLVRDMREFSSGDLMRNAGNKDDLLSRGRVATLVVAGSDTVHLSVKDEQGHVLAKGDIELLSDAKLELMDRSYSLNHSAVHLGQRFFVRVTDPDHDVSEKQDVVNVAVKGPHGTATLKLTETMPHSGVFSAPLEPRLAAGVAVTSVTAVAGIDVALGDELTFTYTDAKPLQSTSPVAHEIKGRVHHGGDGNMAGFTKRFQDPDMAVKTRFLMAEALFEMAKHHRKLKQEEQATAEIAKGKRILEEAMRDYPDTKYVAQGEYLLANLAQEMKKYTEAVGRYSNIIGTWPDSEYAIKAQLKKAICYEKLKLPAQSAEEYVRLTYMYPDSSYVADATVRLANQYYKTKNYKTAGRIFKKFYDRHPEHALGAKSLFLAGQCSMKMEDYTEAVFRFKDLIRAYPDETTLRPEAMYWLGDAAFLGNDPVTAFKSFKQVTWDYPSSKWAKIARGRLTDQRFQTMDE